MKFKILPPIATILLLILLMVVPNLATAPLQQLGWKTYQDSENGLEFKAPANWTYTSNNYNNTNSYQFDFVNFPSQSVNINIYTLATTSLPGGEPTEVAGKRAFKQAKSQTNNGIPHWTDTINTTEVWIPLGEKVLIVSAGRENDLSLIPFDLVLDQFLSTFKFKE
jgi:hypothetical protein